MASTCICNGFCDFFTIPQNLKRLEEGEEISVDGDSNVLEKWALAGCPFAKYLNDAINSEFSSLEMSFTTNFPCINIQGHLASDSPYKLQVLSFLIPLRSASTTTSAKRFGAEIYSVKGDPAAAFLKEQQAIPDLAATENYQLAKSWISKCIHSHENCPGGGEPDLPTRVIDVSPSIGPSFVKLHATANSEKGYYVSLSYCWGDQQALTTRLSNLAAHLEAMPLSSFPKTISDAIHCTRQLGIRYLWVDALCIIQDSEEDKTREITKMPQIYSNSAVTLCAASAKTSQEGFLRVRDTLSKRYERQSPHLRYLCPDEAMGNIYLVSVSHDSVNSPLDEVIYKRAWTLQERILSPRLLTYGVEQFTWQCLTSGYSDLGIGQADWPPFMHMTQDTTTLSVRKFLLNPTADSGTVSLEQKPTLRSFWREIINTYSFCGVSLRSDRLPALSGLAMQFGARLDEKYFAGLWEGDLVRQLMWRSIRPLTPPRSNHRRHPQLAIPTWSWASIDGAVQYGPEYWEGEPEFLSKVIHCRTLLVSNLAPFSGVKGGHLILRGPTIHLSWTELRKYLDSRTNLAAAEVPDWDGLGYIYADENEWLLNLVGVPPPEDPIHRTRYCLCELYRIKDIYYGLILKLAHAGMFSRIGCYSLNTSLPRAQVRAFRSRFQIEEKRII